MNEDEIKAALGLSKDENYLCFSRMGGAGVIECEECGYSEEIVCFIHGEMSCNIGRQCPNCHAFFVEYNESEEYHTFGKTTEDLKCPECGTIVRKKDEDFLKNNDAPLFCPKCHSPRLHYNMTFLT